MDKLKPCPFCGGKARLHAKHFADGSYYSFVDCASCNAQSRRDTFSEAIAAWNARTERTCKNVYEGRDIDRYMMFKCSNCGCVLANHYYPKEWIEQELTDDEFFAYDGERLNYCPNCGAKVVE